MCTSKEVPCFQWSELDVAVARYQIRSMRCEQQLSKLNRCRGNSESGRQQLVTAHFFSELAAVVAATERW